MERKIVTLSVGKPKKQLWKGKVEQSGIGKERVKNALLTTEAFIGDGVANLEFHGGPDRAVCLYPIEHYFQWEKEFNQNFDPPSFGENICASGMLEKDIFIGDIFSAGEAIIQVSQGRIPCSTISKHNGEDKLLGRIVQTGYTGYFFRVIQEGNIYENSNINLLDRKQNKISILEGNHIMFHDLKNQKAIEALLQIPELAEVWKGKLQKALLNLE